MIVDKEKIIHEYSLGKSMRDVAKICDTYERKVREVLYANNIRPHRGSGPYKFTRDVVLRAAAEIKKGGTKKDVAKKFNVSLSTLNIWIGARKTQPPIIQQETQEEPQHVAIDMQEIRASLNKLKEDENNKENKILSYRKKPFKFV